MSSGDSGCQSHGDLQEDINYNGFIRRFLSCQLHCLFIKRKKNMHLSGKEIFKNEYNSEFFDPHLCCFTAWCTKPFHKSLLQLIFFSSKTRIPVSLSDWQMNVWLSLSRKLHKSSCSNSSDVFVWGFESPRTRPNNVARYINFNLLESSITVASILHCYYCLCVCIYALFCFYLKTTKLKLFIFYASIVFPPLFFCVHLLRILKADWHYWP